MIMNKSAGRTSQDTDSKSRFAFTENNLFCCNNFVATNHLLSMCLYILMCVMTHDLYLTPFLGDAVIEMMMRLLNIIMMEKSIC